MTQINTNFILSGMTCSSCEKIVSKRLKTILGVNEVCVTSQTGQVAISGERTIKNEEITRALADTHYSLIINSTL